MASPTVICPLCTTKAPLHPGTSLFAWTPRWSTITFVCGTCGALSVKPVTPLMRRALEAIGITTVRLPEPHPERPPAGPPLTRDDLLSLHLELQEEDWFAQLQQQVML